MNWFFGYFTSAWLLPCTGDFACDHLNASILEKPLHDELTLFRLISRGDERAFEQIFERYKSRLISYLTIFTKSREEARELTQEIFLKVWLTREGLTEIESPQGYLFSMAKNKALDYLRKASRDSRMRAGIWRSIAQHQHTTEEQVFSNDSARRINEAIFKLSRKQQAVFRLSRMEGLTHDEIAVQLSISKNTVKSHMVASLKFIRNYLSGNY